MITEIWAEKVSDKNILHGDYELVSSNRMSKHGWTSIAEFRSSIENHALYIGEVTPGRFKMDMGHFFNRHAFTLVYFYT